MTITNTMDVYEACRNTPKEALRTIKGGRLNGFSDINPMYRIRKLTEMFGPIGIGWYYKVTNKWIESCTWQQGERSVQETAAFVDLELYIKVGGEWSMPIYGTGGSKLLVNERTGPYMSDECFKMATTDALSVACKALGIGADVYWDKDTSKYTQPEEPETKAEPEKKSEATITDAEWQGLCALAKKKGISIKSVLATFKVKKPAEMTKAQLAAATSKLEEYPDAEEKKE